MLVLRQTGLEEEAMPSEVYYDAGLLCFSVLGSESVFVSLTVDVVFKKNSI